MSVAPLNILDAFNRLTALEQEFDLLQYELDEWIVWPIVRAQIFRLLTFPSVTVKRQPKRIGLAVKDLFALISLPHCKFFVKTYCSALGEETDGKFKDVTFDDLLQELGDYCKVDVINNSDFSRRRGRMLCPAACSTTGIDYLAGLLTRLRPFAKVDRVAAAISAAVMTGLRCEGITVDWVRRSLAHFLATKHVVSWVLNKTKAQILLLADPNEWAWCAAAGELGIRSIELQHGINDRNHYAYSWTAYAIPYKRKMPIPNRLLLYGEHWRREMDAYNFWGDALRVVGGLRVDQYRRRLRNVQRETVPTMVLTTGHDRDGLIQFLLDCVPHLVGKNVQIWIKLHPIYDPDPTPYLSLIERLPGVRVIGGAEDPSTFDLITRAHLHASISSATHYDALALKVPTVILPLDLHEIVLPLYQSGHAFLARTPKELAELLIHSSTLDVPNMVSEYYFASGAIENMKRELSQLPVGVDRASPTFVGVPG